MTTLPLAVSLVTLVLLGLAKGSVAQPLPPRFRWRSSATARRPRPGGSDRLSVHGKANGVAIYLTANGRLSSR